jgi:hypothetical protein
MDKGPFGKGDLTLVLRQCTTAISYLDPPQGQCFVVWQSMPIEATVHEAAVQPLFCFAQREYKKSSDAFLLVMHTQRANRGSVSSTRPPEALFFC